MKLMTKQLEKRFATIGDQSEVDDPIVIAKFFNPSGSGTWYATKYNPESSIFYGYVTGLQFDEWGCFSLIELKAVKCRPFGLGIERDRWFEETRFSKLGL